MNKKVLFVDDDRNILASFRRSLVRRYQVETAGGAEEGLAVLDSHGPFAVVVSDLRMPGLDGINFLGQVRRKSPDSVRVMLTGNADLESAIAAVNTGNIFRLLTKPCNNEEMLDILEACFEQHRLITAERELLQETLRGAIKVLSDILALTKPEIYGRASRILPYVKRISDILNDPSPWETETAAMLCLLGYISLPDHVIKLVSRGKPLGQEDAEIFKSHAAVATRLLKQIPRMDRVARIISYQGKNFDGTGSPADSVQGDDIPLASRILKVLLDFDSLQARRLSKSAALEALNRYTGVYDSQVLAALNVVLIQDSACDVHVVPTLQLQVGMILAESVYLERGGKRILVVSSGQEIGETALEFMKKFALYKMIPDKLKVMRQPSAASKPALRPGKAS